MKLLEQALSFPPSSLEHLRLVRKIYEGLSPFRTESVITMWNLFQNHRPIFLETETTLTNLGFY
jgi:hypothetical protein